jgi:hypothetical protein
MSAYLVERMTCCDDFQNALMNSFSSFVRVTEAFSHQRDQKPKAVGRDFTADRADEEVVKLRLITSSPRPKIEETISCALALAPR